MISYLTTSKVFSVSSQEMEGSVQRGGETRVHIMGAYVIKLLEIFRFNLLMPN